MVDYATLVFDIDSSQAEGAARALAGLNRYAAATATANAKLEKQLRGSNGQFQSQIKFVAENEKEIRRLAASYNPALNAQLRFAEQQKELATAVRLGVVSASEQAEILRTLQASYSTSAQAANKFAASQHAGGAASANVFAQLNDIGVMMAAGQNPFQLAIQQGAQLNQVWASMGAEGKSLKGVAGVLGGAISSMINPMALLTLAVIAGGAALFNWATSASSASGTAEAFNDAISKLKESTDALGNSLSLTVPDNYDKVLEKYGSLNDSIRAHIQLMDSLNAQLIKNSQVDVGGLFSKQFGSWWLDRVDELKRAFNTTYDNARALDKAMNDLAEAKGPDAQIAAYDRLISELIKAGNGIEFLTTEQAAFIIEISRGRDAAIQAREALQELAPPITAAKDEAAVLKEILSTLPSVGELLMNMNEAINTVSAISPYAPIDSTAPRVRPRTIENFGKKKKKKGGGGKSEAEKLKDEMKRRWKTLNESFASEYNLTMQNYNKDLETLKWALNQKLIAQKEYETNLSLLKNMTWGTEYQQNALQYQLDITALEDANAKKLLSEEQYLIRRQKLQHDYYSSAISINQNQRSQTLSDMSEDFAQMNTLAGGGYETLIRAQRSFAASSALINSYLAATQALADPSVPFWGKFAAYAKVLAAGMGAVNAIKGGGSGSGSRGRAAATPATKTEPTKNVLVRLEGDAWLTGMAEQIMTQIYDASKDGRVIVARDY